MAKGMLWICCYATVLTTCFALRRPDTSSISGLYTRNVQIGDVARFQGAVLLVDGKQTSCESVVLDSRAGLVAASCLKYGSDKAVDTSVKYEIVIKGQSGSTTSNRYTISSVNVHPKYNSDTYINNLAVVQFNTNDNSSWKNSIATNPKEWNNEFFIRRSLSDVSSMTWNNILAYSSTETPDYCQKASKIYSANTDDFLCNYAATLSIQNSECKVPYGLVFAAVQPSDVNMVALYSHSAVYGNSMCSKDRKLHYYTLLRNYIGWVADVLGRPVGTFAKDSEFKFAPSISYSMKNVAKNNIEGIKVFSGDSYSQNSAAPDVSTPQTDESIDEKNAPLATAPNTDEIPLPTDTIKSDKQEDKPTEENAKEDDADGVFLDDTSSSTKRTNTESVENNHSKTVNEDAETDDVSSEDSVDEDDKSAETSNEASKESNTNKIVVIAMLAIGGIALVGAVIAWFLIRRKKHAARRQNGWNRESMDQLPRGLRPTVDYTYDRSPTEEIINHYSTRHSGYGGNPMRNTYNSEARRATYNDHPMHGAYNRGTRRDTFEDGTRRDTYGDDARRDTYGDGTRRDTYGDGARQNTYGDGPKRDTYDDGPKRDTYDDYPKRDNYSGAVRRDNYGDSARQDTYDDREGHTTYENSNFQWRLNSTYKNQR
ncbi:hypothetical protein COEREDRAFT_9691 [Coemansia reversa NRRL 1564]|uniref:Uncharacterized protein n=1 Tax=Coemansia reversa (strain ATCC 12441 / NRRL 1564) TaxID=763665 RepID=A0A2G5B7R4_COERN|nr:hypothetical protein COEREDRAFT_9691 [Coemansia reversa NRRL 1564]|eukprot:PIA15058.1 hypothetical protein COEREDRAFT_9691 [Coemansia reversa NRRL 1564]